MKALIFDLDGTLIDSVYAHTLAFQRAFAEIDMIIPAWEIHRRIGISGKLLVKAIARERQREMGSELVKRIEQRHSEMFQEMGGLCKPLPGAVALLAFLRENHVPHGIATSGKRAEIAPSLEALKMGPQAVVVDGSATERAKPDPDLFLECQRQLAVDKSECLVVGDAVWDIHAASRVGMLAVGLLTGGAGEQELYNAGAMRVYRDAGHLQLAIDELGLVL
jgi:HAD superfamily hydrolase (TIGR01549 family)